MNLRNALLIMRKDIEELRNTRYVMFTIILLPLVFSVLMPVVAIGPAAGNVTAQELEKLGLKPIEGVTPQQQVFEILVRNLIFLFFIIPLATPSVIGSYSIVGEKISRSLEPLLATPIDESDLLAGKMLAGVVPAVIATIASFVIFTGLTNVIAISVIHIFFIPGPEWFFTVFILAPLLAFMSMAVTVILSSRLNDIRSVEQAGATTVIPVVGLFILSVTGLNLSGFGPLLAIAAIVLAVDVALFKVSRKLFRREEILTKWR